MLDAQPGAGRDIVRHDVGLDTGGYTSDEYDRALFFDDARQFRIIAGRLKEQHTIHEARAKRRQIPRLLLHLVVGVADDQKIALFPEDIFRAANDLTKKRVRRAFSWNQHAYGSRRLG